MATGVDLQIALSLWTFPMVALGHWFGLRAHAVFVSGDRRRFNQLIGAGLSLVSILGLLSTARQML